MFNSRFVLPDTFYQLNIDGQGEEHHYMVSAKYDRIDLIKPLGHWMLKIFDDEVGLVTLHVDEATARRVAEYADLPIVERDTLFKSEYEGYLIAAAQLMERWTE